jgi:hypothetical protein
LLFFSFIAGQLEEYIEQQYFPEDLNNFID